LRRDHQQDQLRSRRRQDPQYPAQVGAKAAAADENQSLAVITMLIGELHRHTATKRPTDHRRPRDAELIEQITQPCRERSQRIITARLGGFTVSEQIRRHHPVSLQQMRQDRPPGRRTSRHAMNQQQRLAGSRLPKGNPVAVQVEILHLAHANPSPPNGVPAPWHNVMTSASQASSRRQLNLRSRRLSASKHVNVCLFSLD